MNFYFYIILSYEKNCNIAIILNNSWFFFSNFNRNYGKLCFFFSLIIFSIFLTNWNVRKKIIIWQKIKFKFSEIYFQPFNRGSFRISSQNKKIFSFLNFPRINLIPMEWKFYRFCSQNQLYKKLSFMVTLLNKNNQMHRNIALKENFG